MRKKTIAIVIPAAIILLVILCVIAFYSIPFSRANALFISANKSDSPYKLEDETYISEQNYRKLRVVDKTLDENEYVQLKTEKKYHFVNLKNLDLICSVKATVDSFDEMGQTDSFVKKIKISFSFIDYKWIVTDVNIVGD